MKRNLLISFVALILISACSSSNPPVPSGTAITATASSLPPTATQVPPTATLTPTPTLALPIGIFTPAPSSNTKITPNNLTGLQEVARYYGELYFTAALSGDKKLLFVRDTLGVDIYDDQTKKHLYHLDLFGSSQRSNLQVSEDGNWALVDQHWLIHLTSDEGWKIEDLYSTFPVEDGQRIRAINLSPDGQNFSIAEMICNSNGCKDDRFDLINIPDMQIIYSWNGAYLDIHGQDIVFSQDGSAIAGRIENQIIVWRTSDQKQMGAIKNIQGSSPAVFSNDASMLAVGQLDTVQIWDVVGEQPIQTIQGLCGGLQDTPRPVFLDTKRVAILECPGYNTDGEGKVTLWNVADASLIHKYNFGPIRFNTSRLLYEENKDQVTLLTNPRKAGPWIFPRVPSTIRFLDNGDLIFVQTDDKLRNVACIIKPNGQPSCLENVMLGTDDQFYTYAWQDGAIKLYKGPTISGSPAYSVCCEGDIINALDPINNLFFYTVPSRGLNNSSKSGVIGLEDDRFRMGESSGLEIAEVSFSGDMKFAAVCKRVGGPILFDVVDRDKLIIFDLSSKSAILQQAFTCLHTPFILTENGSRLIAASAYMGDDGYARHKLLIMNITPPVERNIFDIGCDNINALTLSPDESILVIACTDGTLRFLDPETAAEIYNLANIDPDLWGLAFSKDGTKLTMASKRGYISTLALPPFSFNP